MAAPPKSITLGTRRSQLARIQTSFVSTQLLKAYPDLDITVRAIDPLGDRDKSTALYKFGEKSLWTGELEELLAKGEVDAVVHSLKDMPTSLPPGMRIGAILAREDPRDALVLKDGSPYAPPRPVQQSSPSTSNGTATSTSASASPSALPSASPPVSATQILKSLPPGSLIGTSSLRRSAQLKRGFPHLRFASARGNVTTRLRKLNDPASFAAERGGSSQHQEPIPDFAALILAAAGLKRLGLAHHISALLDGSETGGGMMYAVGQGALAIEVREASDCDEHGNGNGKNNNKEIIELLRCLDDTATRHSCLAERSLMRALEGGCSVPIGVETEPKGDGHRLQLRAVVVSLEGDEVAEAHLTSVVTNDEEAEELGNKVAGLLVQNGAGSILTAINENRKQEQEEAKAKADEYRRKEGVETGRTEIQAA